MAPAELDYFLLLLFSIIPMFTFYCIPLERKFYLVLLIYGSVTSTVSNKYVLACNFVKRVFCCIIYKVDVYIFLS